MHAQPTNIRPPSKLLLALEGCRASLEYAATLATLPILHSAQRGDGHSVLIFPGLTADDVSTLALREFLRAQATSHINGSSVLILGRAKACWMCASTA